MAALNSEPQDIISTQEELAASLLSLEETEVTDVDDVTDDTEEVGSSESTEITDIYRYPAWGKGSSESICYNDSGASPHMKKTGEFEYLNRFHTVYPTKLK